MICIKKLTFQDICSVDPLWETETKMRPFAFVHQPINIPSIPFVLHHTLSLGNALQEHLLDNCDGKECQQKSIHVWVTEDTCQNMSTQCVTRDYDTHLASARKQLLFWDGGVQCSDRLEHDDGSARSPAKQWACHNVLKLSIQTLLHAGLKAFRVRRVKRLYKRGNTGQKPKHAPFCMKGATNDTSLHQIGPNLASNWCWLYKLPEHVLRFRQATLRTEWQD